MWWLLMVLTWRVFRKDRRYHHYALKGAQNAEKVITISKQVDRDTKELYKIEDDHRIIILNGYDEELFKPKNITREEVLKRFNISKIPEYIVFFAGKLAHFKGVDVLLKAAKIYENQLNGSVMTLIAGNGIFIWWACRTKKYFRIKKYFLPGTYKSGTACRLI